MKNIIIFLPIPFRDRPSRTARTDVRRRLRTYLFTSCFFMAPSPNRNLESHESTKPSKSEPPQYTLILCHAKYAMQKKTCALQNHNSGNDYRIGLLRHTARCRKGSNRGTNEAKRQRCEACAIFTSGIHCVMLFPVASERKG